LEPDKFIKHSSRELLSRISSDADANTVSNCSRLSFRAGPKSAQEETVEQA